MLDVVAKKPPAHLQCCVPSNDKLCRDASFICLVVPPPFIVPCTCSLAHIHSIESDPSIAPIRQRDDSVLPHSELFRQTAIGHMYYLGGCTSTSRQKVTSTAWALNCVPGSGTITHIMLPDQSYSQNKREILHDSNRLANNSSTIQSPFPLLTSAHIVANRAARCWSSSRNARQNSLNGSCLGMANTTLLNLPWNLPPGPNRRAQILATELMELRNMPDVQSRMSGWLQVNTSTTTHRHQSPSG